MNKMRNNFERTDAGEASDPYFFFFFGLCAAHVSHNELSPPAECLARQVQH